MKSVEKKKKTLYGRYDDYDVSFDGEEESVRAKRSHAQKLVDLSDTYESNEAGSRASGYTPKKKISSPETQSRNELKTDIPKKTVRTSSVRTEQKTGETIWPDGYAVTRIRPEENGEFMLVTIQTWEDGTQKNRDIPLTAEQYITLRVQIGLLTLEQAEALSDAGNLCLAIRKGMELLGYGDASVRKMIWKLTSRGIEKDIAVQAAEWLTAHGLIREDDSALRRATQDVRKLWGPHRIMQDLRAQGYNDEAIRSVMTTLTEGDDDDAGCMTERVDFEQNCIVYIRNRYGTVPTERAEKQKLIAALIRLGYDTDTVREVMRQVMKDADD